MLDDTLTPFKKSENPCQEFQKKTQNKWANTQTDKLHESIS